MKFVTDITTQNDDLHARLFIHVGNNWAGVNLQVNKSAGSPALYRQVSVGMKAR
jgi:hypothetical protein